MNNKRTNNIINLIKQKTTSELKPIILNGQINNKSVTYINPSSYFFARKNVSLYEKFDYLRFDGLLFNFLLKTIGVDTRRFSFDMTSLAPIVFETAMRKKQTIYFIGTKEEYISNAVKMIKEKYNNINIVRYRNGYFNDEDEIGNEINNILELKPDILIIGMGAPLQDIFAEKLMDNGYNGTIYTCGGFLHQISKCESIYYYPEWVDKFQIRWVYRFFKEPRVVFRVTLFYPIFIPVFYYDNFKSMNRK